MNQQLISYLDNQAQVVDDDVRQALELANGDPSAALRTALTVNLALSDESERLEQRVSKGYTRKR